MNAEAVLCCLLQLGCPYKFYFLAKIVIDVVVTKTSMDKQKHLNFKI
jgi:hypothetical protein